MPEIRQFGLAISGNRRRKEELSPEDRAEILAAVSSGKSQQSVARDFNASPSSITYTINHWNTHHTLKSQARKGHPQVLTPSNKRKALITVKRNPSLTWNEVPAESGLSVSVSTLRRSLPKCYTRKWKAIYKISLTKKDVKERLTFVDYWKSHIEELKKVYKVEIGIFSILK